MLSINPLSNGLADLQFQTGAPARAKSSPWFAPTILQPPTHVASAPVFGRWLSLHRLGRGLIFLRLSAHHDPQRMVWPWPLQRRSLGPWCAQPHVAFFFGGQDYRHSLGMDRLNDRIRRRRQEAVDKMRTRDRLGLGAAVGAGFGLDAGEG